MKASPPTYSSMNLERSGKVRNINYIEIIFNIDFAPNRLTDIFSVATIYGSWFSSCLEILIFGNHEISV